jgi:hypothetical protein
MQRGAQRRAWAAGERRAGAGRVLGKASWEQSSGTPGNLRQQQPALQRLRSSGSGRSALCPRMLDSTLCPLMPSSCRLLACGAQSAVPLVRGGGRLGAARRHCPASPERGLRQLQLRQRRRRISQRLHAFHQLLPGGREWVGWVGGNRGGAPWTRGEATRVREAQCSRAGPARRPGRVRPWGRGGCKAAIRAAAACGGSTLVQPLEAACGERCPPGGTHMRARSSSCAAGSGPSCARLCSSSYTCEGWRKDGTTGWGRIRLGSWERAGAAVVRMPGMNALARGARGCQGRADTARSCSRPAPGQAAG